MEQVIRKWRMEDKYALAALLNNPRILANLRDGIPYPYTVRDAEEFIAAMLHADQTQTFAFAIVENDVGIGSAGIFRCGNIHFRTAELGYYLGETRGAAGLRLGICAYGYSAHLRGAVCPQRGFLPGAGKGGIST